MVRYIHYGHNKYDPSKFEPIVDTGWLKPYGGLWASRVGANFGWSKWCLNQKFRVNELRQDNCFYFTLKPEARILVINSIDDLKDLPKKEGTTGLARKLIRPTQVFLDYSKLQENYDAIEFNISNDRRLYWYLYGWDCDCTLIMNKHTIETGA